MTKREITQAVARAFLVFAVIFAVCVVGMPIAVLLSDGWNRATLAAAPLVGFMVAVRFTLAGGFLVFPAALAFFLWRARRHPSPPSGEA